MKFQYNKFDTSRLELYSLSERKHDLDMSVLMPLKPTAGISKSMKAVAKSIVFAKRSGASIVLMMGAHVIRSGVQRYIIDLMNRGFISCISTNGAAGIHDYEFALIGQTTEDVARYVKEGRFGLWKETGRINDIVKEAASQRLGLGEAIGQAIEEEDLPNKDISIFAAGYRLGIPVTVHVGIGYDIVHELPNCDGAAYGAGSYTDFLRFVNILDSLENGVVMNFGSAVMGPEVFLKGLSMARNAAGQENRQIRKFTTLVCDLHDLPQDFHQEADKSNPGYFFRPWKTMLVRTVAEGGHSYYIKAPHKETIPELWTALNEEASNE